MLFINADFLPAAGEDVQRNFFIEVNNSKITATGPMENLKHLPESAISLKDRLVIPGLINAHNHCAMTLYRGLADDLALNDWLHGHIFPAEAKTVSPEMVYWCTKLAAAEMMLSGTTTVADGYFFSGEAAKAFSDCAMRAVVAHGIVDFAAPSVPDPSKNIEALKQYLNNWQDRHPLISPAIFAHAPYTCSPKTLKLAKSLADERECKFFIHLAESPSEQERIIDPQGATPVQHLNSLGLLDSNCNCVHMVWLTEKDLDIVSNSGAGVILCPQSNFKLCSGIARAQVMKERGIRLGLGTDGCASNNGLDMFREMGMLARSQKISEMNATAMNATDVLQIATVSNAEIIGTKKGGQLKVGHPADLVILEMNTPQLTPFFSPDTLVYSETASSVESVMINGEFVVKNRDIISFDLEETLFHVRKLAKQISNLT